MTSTNVEEARKYNEVAWSDLIYIWESGLTIWNNDEKIFKDGTSDREILIQEFVESSFDC